MRMDNRIIILAAVFALGGRLGAEVTTLSPSGETDMTPRVAAAIAGLAPGDTLRFEKGVYHFYPAGARRMWLNPSNNKTGMKRVAFALDNLRRVTIDGGGSVFIWHGDLFPFAATNATDLTVRNFEMRSRFPEKVSLTVLEKTDEGFLVSFAGDSYPHAVRNGGLFFQMEGAEIGSADRRLSFHATRERRVSYLFAGDTTASLDQLPAPAMRANAEARGPERVFFRYRQDDRINFVKCPYAVGDKLLINLAERRERLGLFFRDCTDVTVENVRISRGAGMGVVAQMCENVTLRGLRVVPLPGEKESITADAMQVINCTGRILVENCETSSMLDDVIDVHGNYLGVAGTDGCRARVVLRHKSHEGFFPYRAGDALEFVDAHTRKLLLTARVKGLESVAPDLMSATVVTDADLSSLPRKGVLVDNVTRIPASVTLRGNHFHDCLCMRFSGRSKWLVENNRIENCGDVLCLDLEEYWSESGPIRDMTIRDNDFIRAGGIVIGLTGWRGHEKDLPRIHDRIEISGNRFVGMKPSCIRAFGVRDLKIAGNSFTEEEKMR